MPSACSCIAGVTTAPVKPVKPVITLSDNALGHLHKLRAESGGDELLLRIGVKSGGCSGELFVNPEKQIRRHGLTIVKPLFPHLPLPP